MAGVLWPRAAQGLGEVAFPVNAGALQSEGDQLLLKAGHSGEVTQKYLVSGGGGEMVTEVGSTQISKRQISDIRQISVGCLRAQC